MTPFEWVVILIALLVRWIYRSLTGAAEREREEERRRQAQWRKEEYERECQERTRRNAERAAQKEFEEAVTCGQFPSDEVLAALAHCDSEIHVNLKEATEELLCGRCSLHTMAFSDAVALIRQRKRIDERSEARAARGEEPTGPVSHAEAYRLLGVNEGCSQEQLASAYRRKVSQWHPDKLETMADELKAYATRCTARLNEAYEKLRARA